MTHIEIAPNGAACVYHPASRGGVLTLEYGDEVVELDSGPTALGDMVGRFDSTGIERGTPYKLVSTRIANGIRVIVDRGRFGCDD